MKYDWQKLTKDEIAPFMAKIDVEEFRELFKNDSQIEVLRAPLSFYKNFAFYRFTTFASMPSISLEFLSDGESVYFLDGAPDPIYYVNDAENLNLMEFQVLDYLTFFFSKVEGTEGDIYLITDPKDSPFMSSVSDEFKKHLQEQYKGFQIRFDDSSGRFSVKAPMFFEGSMVEAVIAVSPKGELELLEHKMLFSVMGSSLEWSNEVYT